jgi:iron complex transport system substrate-binding protein
VSLDDVRTALAQVAREDVSIVSLRPIRLRDVWSDIRSVGRALGREEQAESVASRLERRCSQIAERAASIDRRPTVLTIEWLDPVMVGGTWMPDLVALARGSALVTKPGQHAPTVSFDELSALDPDVVLIKPCGFDLARTAEELPLLGKNLPWRRWSAVRQNRVFVADGNAYFNRPGPRLVESLEILAACVHPREFSDFLQRHRQAVRKVTPDLALE